MEAVKSQGGGFYELTVVATGDKQRYLADVFEMVAKPVKEEDESFELWFAENELRKNKSFRFTENN